MEQKTLHLQEQVLTLNHEVAESRAMIVTLEQRIQAIASKLADTADGAPLPGAAEEPTSNSPTPPQRRKKKKSKDIDPNQVQLSFDFPED